MNFGDYGGGRGGYNEGRRGSGTGGGGGDPAGYQMLAQVCSSCE